MLAWTRLMAENFILSYIISIILFYFILFYIFSREKDTFVNRSIAFQELATGPDAYSGIYISIWQYIGTYQS
jgi:hypothetical protein